MPHVKHTNSSREIRDGYQQQYCLQVACRLYCDLFFFLCSFYSPCYYSAMLQTPMFVHTTRQERWPMDNPRKCYLMTLL